MPNDNKIAIITIESIVPSDYGVKLNAQDKKVYNVSKTKKDGTPSVAWQQLTDMGLKGTDPISGTAGSTVEIWYREVENSHGGTSRYISSFKETNGVPTSAPTVTETPRHGANIASQGGSQDDFGRRLALHGMVNGLLAGGASVEQAREALKSLLSLEEAINAELSKPKGWAELGQKLKGATVEAEKVEQVAPDIQELADEMEINGDDLPF
jgi:hypothetical protein